MAARGLALDDEAREGRLWIFTEHSLAQARKAANTHAVQALRRAAAETRAAGDLPHLLSFEEGCQLVLFHALHLAKLCECCGVPSEVQWTANVFYHRFFAVRSPMEFDPLLLMLVCVHLACKIEEVHEFTLDGLLEAGGFHDCAGLRDKVVGLELPLLEGLGFVLLVEPKPGAALRMLACELRQGRGPVPRGRRRSSAALMPEAMWEDIVVLAERIALDASVRTDAALLWPASVLATAALGVALGARRAEAVVEELLEMLEGFLEEDGQVTIRNMVSDATLAIQRLAVCGEGAEEVPLATDETAASARQCHLVFEHMRELSAKRHEKRRQERKLRRGAAAKIQKAVAATHRIPTPMRHALAMLNRPVAAEIGRVTRPLLSEATASDGSSSPEDVFIRRRLTDTLEDALEGC